MLAACSGSDDAATPFVCKLGELQGTWRIVYTESDGSCGKVPDEVAILGASSADGGTDDGCTYRVNEIAADKCSGDLDFTCPTSNKTGTQHWIGTTKQTSETTLSGTMSLQVELGGNTCRSTYAVAWTRQ